MDFLYNFGGSKFFQYFLHISNAFETRNIVRALLLVEFNRQHKLSSSMDHNNTEIESTF